MERPTIKIIRNCANPLTVQVLHDVSSLVLNAAVSVLRRPFQFTLARFFLTESEGANLEFSIVQA